MAGEYGCEFCNGANPVEWLLTNLAAGRTLSACADDFPVALIPVLAGELGVDADGLYDVIKAHVDQAAAQAAQDPTQGQSSPASEQQPPPLDGGPDTLQARPPSESPTSPGVKTTRHRAKARP